MNIPNTITMARLLLTVLVFVCLELSVAPWRTVPVVDVTVGAGAADPNPTLVWVAFVLFVVAAVTDFLDGYLARKWNMVTAFGRIADPFADKILIAGTLITLLQFPAARAVLSYWFVVVVVAREFLVTAIRGYVESTGKAFGADQLGKWKMVLQCWTCGSLMTIVAGSELLLEPARIGYWATLVLTVVSGLNYVVKARKLIGDAPM